MKTNGFTRIESESKDPASQQYVRFYLYMDRNATSFEPDFNSRLFTWQVPVARNRSMSNYAGLTNKQVPAAYSVGVSLESPLFRDHKMLVPSMNNQDAKVSLLFLDSSNVIYNIPTSDPWFAASQVLPAYYPGHRVYSADQPASVIACTTRVSICKPGEHSTEDCAGAFDHRGLTPALRALWKNTEQAASVEGAIWYINRGKIFDSDVFYQTPGLPALMSQWSVDGITQTDNITSDRWQSELEHAFQASLAALQAAAVELASGSLQWEYLPLGPYDSVCNPPKPNGACRKVCKTQKINSPKHHSFSVLGICIILFLGGLLIVVGYWIEWCTSLAE
ncbi:hypothetical protein M3J09_013444 [Ascochyta lentis]